VIGRAERRSITRRVSDAIVFVVVNLVAAVIVGAAAYLSSEADRIVAR